MAPGIGDRAPAFEASLPGGGTIGLDELLGQPLLLIFLRHLA